MRIFAFILATLAGVASVSAADVYGSSKGTPAHVLPTAVAPIEAANWSGIWVAALAGYSMSNTDLSVDAFDHQNDGWQKDVAGASGIGGEGFDATVQLGADYQIGRVVFGGWAEYQFGGTESSAFADGLGRAEIEQNDAYGAFARVGLALDKTLVYVAGGYVWTEADVSFTDGDEIAKRTFDFSGPALEFGLEHMFSPNVRGKLAGRYTWLSDERLIEDHCERLNGEPGVLSVKAGLVISAPIFSGGTGLGIFAPN